MAEFDPFPKIPRLNRDVVITEKIDGTNAAVIIEPIDDWAGRLSGTPPLDPDVVVRRDAEGEQQGWRISAQSRKRLITPGKSTDNYGFAGWVRSNKEELVDLLGRGRHFGEWWGTGIQHGYGLASQRNFSLFRPRPGWQPVRLSPPDGMTEDSTLDVVPVMYEGPFLEVNDVNGELPHQAALWELKWTGSVVAPGWRDPEGIIIYHTASGQLFKVTLENDEKPKEVVAREIAKVAANGGGRVDYS